VTVFGANHNHFNTVWSASGGYPGSFDDVTPGCRGRLTQRQQRRVGAAYVVGFFRRYLGNDRSLEPMWTGEATPPSIAPATTAVSYHAPDLPGRRLDVARFTDPGDLSVNHLGGAVTASAMSTYGWCADRFEDPCIPGDLGFLDVHLPGLAQGVFGWADPSATVRFELGPGAGDIGRFDALQFRTAQNVGEVPFGPRRQDLIVALVDVHGAVAEVAASDVGDGALRAPSGLRRFVGHVILQQLRFPLETFAGVDLSAIRAIELRFSRTPFGAIDVADLAFTSGAG
jgi:hypothetical protein